MKTRSDGKNPTDQTGDEESSMISAVTPSREISLSDLAELLQSMSSRMDTMMQSVLTLEAKIPADLEPPVLTRPSSAKPPINLTS
jgi:hypothetical protein